VSVFVRRLRRRRLFVSGSVPVDAALARTAGVVLLKRIVPPIGEAVTWTIVTMLRQLRLSVNLR
jgi:hypothetical protein